MRLFARCRYGLRATYDIAVHDRGLPAPVREVFADLALAELCRRAAQSGLPRAAAQIATMSLG